MRIPYSLLREFVNTSLTAQQAGELLTMAGFELEGMEGTPEAPVLNVKIMANRGDALSALGLAREILAKDSHSRPTDLYVRVTDRYSVSDASMEEVKLDLQTPDCTRYAYLILRGIKNQLSPEWLQTRLTEAGMRPINLVVDLTNLVMLELGQPLHAFDLDKIRGSKIIVRHAHKGEKLKALNDVEYSLNEEQMMICDSKGPIAAAGIMGGADSEVTLDTTNLLIESAHFNPASIRRTRNQMKLSTESSYRFERWVDPEGVPNALSRFRELYIQIASIQPTSISPIVGAYPSPPSAKQITLRMDRARKLLGMPVQLQEAEKYFATLGFKSKVEGDSLCLTPPSWRPDVKREVDLVEEVGRIHGYDKIPEEFPKATTTQGGVFGEFEKIDKVREASIRQGLTQVITHSLRHAHPLDDPVHSLVEIRNPHSPEASKLRSSLLACLSDVSKRNRAQDIQVFEIGKVFYRDGNTFKEYYQLGIWMVGPEVPPHWSCKNPPIIDFYHLKGVVEGICDAIGLEPEFETPQKIDPRFHPTRQAVLRGNKSKNGLGYIGQIHPDIAEELELSPNVYFTEINLSELLKQDAKPKILRHVSRNPSIRRDIAIVIDKSVPYSKIESSIKDGAGETLEKVWLFDVYEGKGIPEGQHSLAIAMQLRKQGQNLTDEEANKVRDTVIDRLKGLGAVLRQ